VQRRPQPPACVFAAGFLIPDIDRSLLLPARCFAPRIGGVRGPAKETA